MCFLPAGGLPGARLLYRGSDRGRRAASGARSRKLDCSRGGRTGRSALDGTRKRRFVGVRCLLESGRRAEDDARRVQLSGRRRTGQRNRIRFFRDRRVCRRPALGFRFGQGRSACRTLARGGRERDLYQQRDRSARRRYGSRRSRFPFFRSEYEAQSAQSCRRGPVYPTVLLRGGRRQRLERPKLGMESDSGRGMSRRESPGYFSGDHREQYSRRLDARSLGDRRGRDGLRDGRAHHARRPDRPHSLYVPQHRARGDRSSGYQSGDAGRFRRLCPEESGLLRRFLALDRRSAAQGRAGLAERGADADRTLGRLCRRQRLGHRRVYAGHAALDDLSFRRAFRADRRRMFLFRPDP